MRSLPHAALCANTNDRSRFLPAVTMSRMRASLFVEPFFKIPTVPCAISCAFRLVVPSASRGGAFRRFRVRRPLVPPSRPSLPRLPVPPPSPPSPLLPAVSPRSSLARFPLSSSPPSSPPPPLPSPPPPRVRFTLSAPLSTLLLDQPPRHPTRYQTPKFLP